MIGREACYGVPIGELSGNGKGVSMTDHRTWDETQNVPTEHVKSSQLRVGDVVREHGMRVRINSRREHADANTFGGRFHAHDGTVLNLAEVIAARIVPAGWLRTEKWVDGSGWVADRDDQWTVQGNDLASWTREMCSCGYPGTPQDCAANDQARAIA